MEKLRECSVQIYLLLDSKVAHLHCNRHRVEQFGPSDAQRSPTEHFVALETRNEIPSTSDESQRSIFANVSKRRWIYSLH